jgi:hypothetical protein
MIFRSPAAPNDLSIPVSTVLMIGVRRREGQRAIVTLYAREEAKMLQISGGKLQAEQAVNSCQVWRLVSAPQLTSILSAPGFTTIYNHLLVLDTLPPPAAYNPDHRIAIHRLSKMSPSNSEPQRGGDVQEVATN